MKTTHVIRICLVAVSFSLVVACKKDNAKNDTPSTTNLQTSSDDQAMSSNENDALSNDISASLESNTSFARVFADPDIQSDASMRVDGASPVCDAALSFDTAGSTKKLTITYNGTNCWGGRSRSGSVTISEAKGVHWIDAGAVVTITIQNLTITRVADGKSIVINGVKKITNTSGGLLFFLANHGPITHDISDTLTIACDKGAAKTWNVSKHRVFEYDNGIKLTTTGTHSDGSHSDISDWGTDRFGVGYSSRITVPKVISQACSFRLIKGQDTFSRGDNFMAAITYGLDASGNPLTSCPGESVYAKATWTYIPTGATGSFLFRY
jgi:hypothetical protein